MVLEERNHAEAALFVHVVNGQVLLARQVSAFGLDWPNRYAFSIIATSLQSC